MGLKAIDAKEFIGKRNGRLVCLSEAPRRGTKRYFLFQCDCGKTKEILLYSFKVGRVRSCGCISVERIRLVHRRLTKNLGALQEYKVWAAMIHRCTNPNNANFNHYGGRGITVCKEWLGSYAQFLEDMGRRPTAKHSLDRIDNSGNYEPANCRWATMDVQSRNRRSNHILTHNGQSLHVTDWAAKLGCANTVLHSRLKLGWTIADTVTRPVRPKRPPHSAARKLL